MGPNKLTETQLTEIIFDEASSILSQTKAHAFQLGLGLKLSEILTF